jgi:pimeloyl-ACP methyl ester carboxylesterase
MPFQEDHYEINGIDTAVLTAGEGEPLVFLHGAGTALGFDSLLRLAERRRLIVPNHPGFGASADDPSIDHFSDYVLHYLDLFDHLGLEEVALAGHSMGGHLASSIALLQPPRVSRLVLAAPFGLWVREHPTVDFFSIPDEEVVPMLTADPSIFSGIEMPPTPEFLAARYRESTSFARVAWKRPYDPKLVKWLHRLTMPALVVWGDADSLIPVEQAAIWAAALPNAETKILPGVGHLLFDESREAVDAVGGFVSAGVAA